MEGKWREDGVTVLRASGHGACSIANSLATATRPYVMVSVGENWGLFSSQVFNRTGGGAET